MPDVDESDGGAGVQAEDAHRGERRYHARQEAEHVRDGGHGDGDRRLAEGPAHPLLQLKCPVLFYPNIKVFLKGVGLLIQNCLRTDISVKITKNEWKKLNADQF